MKFSLFLFTIYGLVFTAQTDTFVKTNSPYKLKTEYKTPIYAKAKISPKNIIKNNNNNSNSKIIAENKNWLKIKFWLNDSIREIGFVKKQKAYIHKYFPFYNYWIYVQPKKWNSNQNKQFLISLRKYDTDSIFDTITIANSHHGERFFEQKYQSGLKDVKKIIRFETYRESCPGLTENEFIILVDNKLKSLITETSTGEIGWEIETIYQPILFENGTIKMLYLNYESEIVNRSTGELNEFKDASQFNIPLDELIIKQISIGEPIIRKR